MEIVLNKYKYLDYNLTLAIKSQEITGILVNNTNDIANILSLKITDNRNMMINNDKVLKSDINNLKKEIALLPKEINYTDNITVRVFLENIIIERELDIKDVNKKLEGSLKIVGLPINILDKEISMLSKSEKILILLAQLLIPNPKIIILEEPFLFLDNTNEKKIVFLLNKLKDQYKKTIVLISNDSNILYKHTNSINIIKNNEVISSGETKEIYHNVVALKRNKIEIPISVLITNKAKEKKKIHLDYHSDIRDLIKDIYKHV